MIVTLSLTPAPWCNHDCNNSRKQMRVARSAAVNSIRTRCCCWQEELLPETSKLLVEYSTRALWGLFRQTWNAMLPQCFIITKTVYTRADMSVQALTVYARADGLSWLKKAMQLALSQSISCSSAHWKQALARPQTHITGHAARGTRNTKGQKGRTRSCTCRPPPSAALS